MLLIAAIVLMNVLGLLSIGVALVLVSREKRGWGDTASSRRGQGTLSILAGGCTLAAGGQYGIVRLLYEAAINSATEPRLSSAAAGLLVVGIVFLALGAFLLYAGGEREVTPHANPDSAAIAHGVAMAVVVVAMIFALVGLNLYQFLTPATATISQAKSEQQRPKGSDTVPASLTDQQTVDRFRKLFHDHVFSLQRPLPKWSGIPIQQNPTDVWIHQEILYDVKPDFIVETGTGRGGSTILWAMIIREFNPKAKVITIDIDDYSEEARKVPIWKERIEFLKGSSTDPKMVAEVMKRVKGGKVMVILDSDHSRDHVLKEMQLYAPLVDVGSYLCVQDTFYDHPPAMHPQEGPGPWAAVQEFLAKNNQFQIDREREQFLYSFNPGGYLKRVK
jgi:cephalosporin hydroxylase